MAPPEGSGHEGRQPRMNWPAYRSTQLRAPAQPAVQIAPTPAETSGPAFGDLELGPLDHDPLANHAAAGESPIGPRILVHGVLRDGSGRPVPHALVEIWQANAGGRYRHKNDGYLAPLDPNFGGWGRALTGEDGSYAFRTVAPGAYPWPNGPNSWRPAHIHFSVFGPQFSQRLITQMYFEGDPHIPLCPIVQAIPDAAAVDSLVARLDIENSVSMDLRAYRFDIVLAGPQATWIEARR